MAVQENPFRQLPSVDRLLADQRLRPLAEEYPPSTLVGVIRECLATIRDLVRQGGQPPTYDELVESLVARIPLLLGPSLRPVINATGVIIHTNLGRAPLSKEALQAMATVSRGYSNLEYDLEAGERGSRHTHLESLLTRLTGAEAALAVNNNAAAVLLTLTALAHGREVIISRGQLVEIGGGFRIPDVMRQSGARLVEVGTTNRTYLRDYEEAITPETVALLRVHTSNFRITGFTTATPLAELVRLAHDRGLIVIDDLGSGCLLDVTVYGLAPEPMVQESIATGADIVLFSGDKLLGGPQAGIILGRQRLVSALRRHPLARAVRMDKASIAGLAVTLLHYLRGEVEQKVPVWRMIATPMEHIERRARAWAASIQHGAVVIEGRSMVGGGSLPEEGLPTYLLAVSPPAGCTANELAARLRRANPPVVARIERDCLVLDPRTVDPEEDDNLLSTLRAALAAPSPERSAAGI